MTTSSDVTKPPRRRFASLAITNYVVDILLFVAFAVDYNLRFTGLSVHEWLGLIVGVMIIAHSVMHWDWMARTVRRIRTTKGRQRLSGVLVLATFMVVVVVVISGVFDSRSAVPSWSRHDPFWRWIHRQSADLATLLLAVHIAISWRWLLGMTKRVVGRRPGATTEVAK